MTNEYISKQEVIDIVVFECGKWTGLAKEISKQLKQLPAADLVPVVRCKDCKHCYFADNRVPDEQGWVCEINSSEPVNLNGFCSYGERRKQE